jgi:hypothetical protein
MSAAADGIGSRASARDDDQIIAHGDSSTRLFIAIETSDSRLNNGAGQASPTLRSSQKGAVTAREPRGCSGTHESAHHHRSHREHQCAVPDGDDDHAADKVKRTVPIRFRNSDIHDALRHTPRGNFSHATSITGTRWQRVAFRSFWWQ